MQSVRTLSIMKKPTIMASTPSTPPSPQSLPSKTTSLRTLSSKKPRNILTNPIPEEDPKWVPLNLSRSELYLPLTFPTGQTFRWKQTGPIQYTGVVGRSHLVSLKQLDNGDVGYYFHCTTSDSDSESAADARIALLDFLNVGISLTEVWESFKASDKRFAELAIHLEGARVLRQDPIECLIQFICSSNNNIKRITMMVDFISSLGNYLGAVGGFKFYEFPSLERLAMVSEQELRAAGFGYRAMRIQLLGKNKPCIVDGSWKKEDFGTELGHQWNRCNVIVQGWIMSSVTQDLHTGTVYATSARAVWEDLQERFDKVNASRIYQLHKAITTNVQGLNI
ncbi:N-glycosylase/DNA lyase OGG1 isoform X5 [Solanum lycopersicum]|uniref:N-glycosylase/DNA lyase OGG1 isoform X5 n=1 Tax=Solanum lycopersicum TaxID=4081 RepID=UPI003749F889